MGDLEGFIDKLAALTDVPMAKIGIELCAT